jgi:hypothetical protein
MKGRVKGNRASLVLHPHLASPVKGEVIFDLESVREIRVLANPSGSSAPTGTVGTRIIVGSG